MVRLRVRTLAVMAKASRATVAGPRHVAQSLARVGVGLTRAAAAVMVVESRAYMLEGIRQLRELERTLDLARQPHPSRHQIGVQRRGENSKR